MSTKGKSIFVGAAVVAVAAVALTRLARIFGRPLADTEYDATNESSSDSPDSFVGYVKALEKARERRGRLFHRR